MDNTYIKLFRKMLSWEWYKDTCTTRVFLHILLRANYKPSKYKGMDIDAGECVFGRKQWAEELGLSEQQVKTALKHLKSTNEITIKSTNKFSVVRVEKWAFWQIEEGGTTSKVTSKLTNKQPTTNQQLTTSKESKKVINKESLSYADKGEVYRDPLTGRIRFNTGR